MPAWAYQPIHNVFFLVFAEVGVVGIVGIVGVGCFGVHVLRKRGNGKELLLRLMPMAPFLSVLWSLAWFDHLLWTSWSGMAYTATAIGMLVGSRRKGAFDSSLADLAKSSSENS
jgi:hypothetical protein